MRDDLGRKIEYLRISLTDRCNLRCRYCIDEKECNFLPEENLLNVDQIGKISAAAALLGVKKIRLTGGEPLLRKDIVDIVKRVNDIAEIEEIALTTNGIYLEEKLPALIDAGLTGVNISLDSLEAGKFQEITLNGSFEKVFRGIELAADSQLKSVKLNVVSLKGVNDNEFVKFAELTKDREIDVRFIELMPIGLGKRYETVYSDEILNIIGAEYELTPQKEKKIGGPARYYKIPDAKGKIGVISPLSHEFCDLCNRIRVSSEGYLKLCLHWKKGIDLKPYLADETTVDELGEILRDSIMKKPDMHHMRENVDSEEIESRFMNEIGG